MKNPSKNKWPRTFYDRDKNQMGDHVENVDAPSPVTPNLTLSLREIFDRWEKNLPLDIVTRNGTYAIADDASDDELDEHFDDVDVDAGDITEVEEELAFAMATGRNSRAMRSKIESSEASIEQSEIADSSAPKEHTSESDVASEILP